MSLSKRIIPGVLLGVLVTASMAAAYVVPILTTEIDPNLGEGQCPGGKDWDLPGSSCHDGLIVDYVLPPLSIKAVNEGILRGDIVRWQPAQRKKKRDR
jgi:hypothetical protein